MYLLSVVNDFRVDLWEHRKLKFHGSNSCASPHSDSLGWDVDKGVSCTLGNGRNGGKNVVVGRNGGSGKLSVDACTCIFSGTTLCSYTAL